jgi:hypothetical protein
LVPAPRRLASTTRRSEHRPLVLPPPKHGTRIRFVDIPPDTEEYLAHGASRMQDAFSEIGDAAASTVKANSPHPLMHRTESVDYGIVIEGELTLVLDDSKSSSKRQRGNPARHQPRLGQPLERALPHAVRADRRRLRSGHRCRIEQRA